MARPSNIDPPFRFSHERVSVGNLASNIRTSANGVIVFQFEGLAANLALLNGGHINMSRVERDTEFTSDGGTFAALVASHFNTLASPLAKTQYIQTVQAAYFKLRDGTISAPEVASFLGISL